MLYSDGKIEFFFGGVKVEWWGVMGKGLYGGELLGGGGRGVGGADV